MGILTCGTLRLAPFKSKLYNDCENVLNLCRLALTTIGTLVILQVTLDGYNGTDDLPASLSGGRSGPLKMMDGLKVAGWVTLAVAFIAIAWLLVMDCILLAKQQQLNRLRRRATALGASFSPKVGHTIR